MKLIEFDGLDFKIADEALLVRPIREMFRADKSKKKEEFWKQISYLWFMCDPRSSYMYIIDDNERSAEIIKQEGLGDRWKPSSLLQEAMSVYKKQTTTTASIFLETMRHSIDDMAYSLRNLGSMMRNLNGTETAKDDGMTLDKALITMNKIARDIPALSASFVQAEKALAKDFASDDKVRGSTDKAAGEDI